MESHSWGMHVVLRMFPNAQLNVQNYFNKIEAALNKYGVLDLKLRLVAYATVAAESSGFSPITERRSHWNTLTLPYEVVPLGESVQYSLYQSGSGSTKRLFEHQDLGNTSLADGETYIGRGFVQLTGKHNYKRYGGVVGRDLLQQPQLANDADIAAEILAAFVRDHRVQIEKSLRSGDLRGARMAVNGGLNGLHRFVKAYETGAYEAGLKVNMNSTRDGFMGNVA
jgi:predicted chitinase